MNVSERLLEISDFLTGYWHPLYVRASLGVYSGNLLCKTECAHAKWHEQSANALVDLIFLTDDMHSLILGKPLNTSSELDATASGREGFVNATAAGCFGVFAEDGHTTDVLAEVQGAVECLEAGKNYDELSGVDKRLTCLSRWSLGTEEQTMDSCLLHSNCLEADTGAVSESDRPSLSFAAVQHCIENACSAHLPLAARFSVAACVATCPLSAAEAPEFACAAECLAQSTTFSATGAAVVHCAARKPKGGNAFQTFVGVAQCVGEQLAPASAFWEAVERSARCSSALA